jgi:prolyl-tRNA synthetase
MNMANRRQLFRLTDRKEQGFLLCPTHEEEITSLVARNVTSYRDMPLKLYQISEAFLLKYHCYLLILSQARKYRDELRPRHGLLRGREFIMKDLYTFDVTVQDALQSYEQVQLAYRNLFEELKLPILVAQASSGDMGGDLSHEYHLPTSLGEDNVVSCTSCDYVANEELAEARMSGLGASEVKHTQWTGMTEDKSTLVNVWYPDSNEGALNIHAVKALVADLDTSIQDPSDFLDSVKPGTLKVINLFDGRLHHLTQFLEEPGLAESAADLELKANPAFKTIEYMAKDKEGNPLNLLGVVSGSPCPKCQDGSLKVQEAIELGHTFHLGTRYSEPLEARVEVPRAILDSSPSSATTVATTDKQSGMVPLQMGCHGIGVTRLIGAVADHLHDDKGLNWPRKIAPYEVAVLVNRVKSNPELLEAAGDEVYDRLTEHARSSGPQLDAVLDDRKSISLGWKMNDADLVGYPVVVVVGKYWVDNKEVEVQCRRLGVRKRVKVEDLPTVVHGLLDRL